MVIILWTQTQLEVIADSECLPISLIMKVQIQIIIIEIIVLAMNDDFVIFNLKLINNRRLLKNNQKLIKRTSDMEI